MQLKRKLEADIAAAVNWYCTYVFSSIHVPDNFSLTIDGECVKVKSTVKMLSLTWKDYIKKISARCDGAINLLRLLCGTRWGAHQKQLLQIYYALICLKLEYVAKAIGSVSETQKKKLERVQAQTLHERFKEPRRKLFWQKPERPLFKHQTRNTGRKVHVQVQKNSERGDNQQGNRSNMARKRDEIVCIQNK